MKLGDLVVLRSNRAKRSKYLNKRSVGTERKTFYRKLFIWGTRVNSPVTVRNTVVQVQKGQCWVVGDNRCKSGNSGNGLGANPLTNIESKIIIRLRSEGWIWIEHGPEYVKFHERGFNLQSAK